MNSLTVELGLLLREATFKDEVDLRGARIGGAARCKRLQLSIHLGHGRLSGRAEAFFWGKKRSFNLEVRLTGAKVGGAARVSGSTFRSALNMDGLTVEQSLFMA